MCFAELKKKDAEREAAEKRVKELEMMRAREEMEQQQRREQAQGVSDSLHGSALILPNFVCSKQNATKFFRMLIHNFCALKL